jgi:hypothetical protein
MDIEAGTKEILDLVLGQGKGFDRMDPVLRARLVAALALLLDARDLQGIADYRRFNLKFFNGEYQINIDSEKRIRFTVEGNTLVIHSFGSTTHKGE